MSASTAWLGSLAQIIASDLPIIISLIFGGCCSHLVTLTQFIFVALEGLLHQIRWDDKGLGLKPRVVPIKRWLILVCVFFTVSVLNNLALGYHISVPLHIIFRSGGLIVNMLLGVWWLKKRYTIGQIGGVVMVTLGVIWATLDNTNAKDGETADPSEFYTGIGILVVAMILSAGMGLYQEVTYKTYGKQWREGLFYTHFLALPFFGLFYKDIISQVKVYNASPIENIPALLQSFPIIDSMLSSPWLSLLRSFLNKLEIPRLWLYLSFNVFTQYVCISGVNRMTSMSTSLTLNLVLNLRKFTSLIISIFYFDNEFGLGAKTGTFLVFLGTLVYARSGSVPPPIEVSSTGKESSSKNNNT
ncbi:UAA transporter [Phycomyces nitens]|nr:UAA transporter [Phycomyces nitens]